ncbi:class II fructose-bisphosphate aldolase [Tepidanaerobacter acetatoxydans]|uniref:class II fructose-bisphosphate aldolase n=1 Tax=Tepidanaerobacter acetatoxydans TaxID=499229 RepID=UPI001BD21729|nr:class II fructose-bisphosphate aldolase [Tepidanaerobacter acetatoxydans]
MLCRMDDILKKATQEQYGVAAPNVWNLETIKAAVGIAEKLKSPIILDYGEGGYEENIFEVAMIAKHYGENASIPVAINLDHGETFKGAVRAIKAGFTSIMVDRSSRPFEENLKDTKELCKIAHAADVSVEAELGHVGVGEEYADDNNSFTKVEEAQIFVKETGVDCLAIAVGTAHGHYAGVPKLDFERITQLRNSLDIPLVLHGGSSTGDEALQKAIKSGISKVNLFTDLSDKAIDFMKKMLEIKSAKQINLIDFYDEGIKGYSSELERYIRLFGSDNKA